MYAMRVHMHINATVHVQSYSKGNLHPSLAVDKENMCSATFVYQRVACTR